MKNPEIIFDEVTNQIQHRSYYGDAEVFTSDTDLILMCEDGKVGFGSADEGGYVFVSKEMALQVVMRILAVMARMENK